MNKRNLLTLVALLLILLVVVILVQDTEKLDSTPSISATSTEVHKLLGYYSTYQLGTTTCSAFISPAGDVDFIRRDSIGVNPDITNVLGVHFAMLNIDIADITPVQKKILLNSSSTDINYVYLSVKSNGKVREYTGINTCESYVMIDSVVPMVSDQNLLTSSNTSQANETEYIGIISSSTDGQNVYTSPKYKFQFEYPQNWYTGENHSGTLQLFNYDRSIYYNRNMIREFNKLELIVVDSDKYDPSPSDIFREKSRDVTAVVVAGRKATRTIVTLVDGSKILTYHMSIPTEPNILLVMNIYGNPSNFIVLDDLVSTLQWLK